MAGPNSSALRVAAMCALGFLAALTWLRSGDRALRGPGEESEFLALRPPSSLHDDDLPTPYAAFIPTRPASSPSTHQRRPPGSVRQVYVENLPPKCLPPGSEDDFAIWNTCDPDPAKVCALDKVGAKITLANDVPQRLSHPSHMPTVDFIRAILKHAWGTRHPSIDLYVRAGCNGADELKYLFETVELFWPTFLGDVLVVLDYGNDLVLEHLLPLNRTQHTFKVVYERCPCMKPRFFNQVSYLTLDRHSESEFAVTLDSDCALHTPVTPDILFNDRRQLIMPTAIYYYGGYSFDEDQQAITKRSFLPLGHSMCTQPVSVVVDSMRAYREWVKDVHGGKDCYEAVLSRHMDTNDFCWMCQLNVFLYAVNYSAVDLHFLDERRDPYFRYASHVTYELWNWKYWTSVSNEQGGVPQYHAAVVDLVKGGLCRWFGRDLFEGCTDELEAYHRHLTTTYADNFINVALNATVVEDHFREVMRPRMDELVRRVLASAYAH